VLLSNFVGAAFMLMAGKLTVMSIDLNSRAAVTALDPKGMLHFTEEYPNQCRQALTLVEGVEFPTGTYTGAMLTGLGGSAVGGDYVRAMFDAFASIPFAVNRDYHLPAYVGKTTLVFATSYSGNTEETLSAYADAKAAGAQVICVTSGGKLKELALADGYPVITVPGGQPPRTALGFMLIPVLAACVKMGLLPSQDFSKAFDLLESLCKEWTVEGSSSIAKELGASLHGKLGIIYGLGTWQAIIANRWKGQINENAKNHIFVNTFPELNHNEILGWVKAGDQGVAQYVGMILEDGEESAKMKKRAEVTEGLVKDLCSFAHVTAIGDNLLEKLLSLTYLGDFVSLYLAVLNQVDPENIDSINILKTSLASVS
jgi:glucose/mannose-6-phosphate isomerase